MHHHADANLDDILWKKRRWNGSTAYAESKLHDAMLAFAIARRWPDVFSNALEPGWVPTKMGGSDAPDDMDQAPPAPGFGEKYWNLSGFPSHSLESGGGAFLTVICGQIFAYSAFSDSHFSSPGSVSGFMASTGHSGTQTLQSMHSSGLITSMFSPS
jgi:hypothetical protein